MGRNERTSKRIARIASLGLRHPGKLTRGQIKSISASVLTQASDRKRK